MLKDNLILLRNMHGFSQEGLAAKIGISRQAYSKWESGATVPDIEKCAELAAVYGVSIDSLMAAPTVDGVGTIPPAPKGKCIFGTVTVNDRGQIVIPKAARDSFRLNSGDRLVVLGDERGIALIPAEAFEESMRAAMAFAAKPAET